MKNMQNYYSQRLSDEAIEKLVLQEQVVLVYRLATPAIIVSIVPVVVVWWLINDIYPGVRSTGWLIASMVFIAFRFVLGGVYKKSPKSSETAGFWGRLFAACTLVYGIQWGYAGTVLFPVNYPELQVVMAAILIGTAAGAFPFVMSMRWVYASHIIPAMLPFALYLIYLGSPEYILVGILSLLFIVIMLFSTLGISQHVTENLSSRFKQNLMAEEIMAINQRLQSEIEERKRAEKDMELSKQAAEESRRTAEAANRAKSQFLANMSHEIRTPLNGVLGMTELLINTELNSEQREYAEAAHQSGEALLEIIGNILDLSKIEAGAVELENKPFHLRNIISQTFELIAPRATAKGLRVSYTIPEDFPPLFHGDQVRLRQVLTNLLTNAVKFTFEGSITLTVDRHNKQNKDNFLCFSVADTGIGITSDTQKVIFNPFVQADGSTTRQYGGTGLGLTICRQLVSLMGGEIWVNSTPGKGSVFSFTVFMPVSDAKQSISAPSHKEMSSGVGCRGKILLVEDNDMNQAVGVAMLKKLNFQVDIANNGLEAVEKVLPGQYDLIFMDCQMPEMDGFAATKEIRRLLTGRSRYLPIIALTAHASESDREQCLAAGMDDYIVKPYTMMQISEKINKYLDAKSPCVKGSRNSPDK